MRPRNPRHARVWLIISSFLSTRKAASPTAAGRIAAGSNYAIVRKAASLYRSRPAVEIHFADRLIARLSAEEMAAIDAQQSPSKFVQSRGQIA